MSHLIIHNAGAVKSHQKFTAAGITLLFWGALLYMWQPLISAVAWAFHIKLFYEHMIVLGGYNAFLQLAAFYVITAGSLMLSLFTWAKVNQFRFSGKDKRNEITQVSDANMANWFDVPVQHLVDWKQAKRVQIQLNDAGDIVEVRDNPQSSGLI
jgi:biofilm PGA synthesis protein PgaD